MCPLLPVLSQQDEIKQVIFKPTKGFFRSDTCTVSGWQFVSSAVFGPDMGQVAAAGLSPELWHGPSSWWPQRAPWGHSCTPVQPLFSGWMAAHYTLWRPGVLCGCSICVNIFCLNISQQFDSRPMKHKTQFCVCESVLGVFYWKRSRPRPDTCLWPTLVVTKDDWRYTKTNTVIYQKWVQACIQRVSAGTVSAFSWHESIKGLGFLNKPRHKGSLLSMLSLCSVNNCYFYARCTSWDNFLNNRVIRL